MKYHIYINSTIGWPISAEYVRGELAKCKDKHCDVYISSLGGDVATALQIRQMFVEHGDVTAHLHGFVASAATIVAMGCKEVRMGTYAFFMIHKCSSWQDHWGQMNADDIAAVIEKMTSAKEALDKIDQVIGSVYAARTGKELSDVVEMMRRETWLKAEEAKDMGFVDEIITDDEEPVIDDELRHRIVACGLPLPELQEKPETRKPAMERLASLLCSLLGKRDSTGEAVQAVEDNPPKNNTTMKNLVLTALCALLCVESFKQQEDGSVSLTEEQLRNIEDRLAALTSDLEGRQTKLDEANNANASLQNRVDELTQQVENLQHADGDETHSIKTEGHGVSDISDDINAAKEANAAYARLSGIL